MHLNKLNVCTHTQIITEVGRNPGGHLAQCTARISQLTSTWTDCETKQKEPQKDLLCGKSLGSYERKKKKILPDGDSSAAALHLLVWPFKNIQGKHMVEVCSWRVSKRGLSVLQWHTLFLSSEVPLSSSCRVIHLQWSLKILNKDFCKQNNFIDIA